MSTIDMSKNDKRDKQGFVGEVYLYVIFPFIVLL